MWSDSTGLVDPLHCVSESKTQILHREVSEVAVQTIRFLKKKRRFVISTYEAMTTYRGASQQAHLTSALYGAACIVSHVVSRRITSDRLQNLLIDPLLGRVALHNPGAFSCTCRGRAQRAYASSLRTSQR